MDNSKTMKMIDLGSHLRSLKREKINARIKLEEAQQKQERCLEDLTEFLSERIKYFEMQKTAGLPIDSVTILLTPAEMKYLLRDSEEAGLTLNDFLLLAALYGG